MINNSDNYSVYNDRLKLDQIAYGGSTPEEAQKKKKQKADAKKEYKENLQRRSIIGIITIIIGSLSVAFLPFGLMNFIWGPVIAGVTFGIIEGIYQHNNNNKKQEQLMEETRQKAIEAEEKQKQKAIEEQEKQKQKAIEEQEKEKQKRIDKKEKEKEKRMAEQEKKLELYNKMVNLQLKRALVNQMNARVNNINSYNSKPSVVQYASDIPNNGGQGRNGTNLS